MGNPNDKVGSFTVDSLKKGEYVLGYLDYTVGLNSETTNKSLAKVISVAPNPAKHTCRINFSLPERSNAIIQLCNVKGEVVDQVVVYSHQEFIDWDCSGKPAGTYLCSMISKHASTEAIKIVVN